MKFCWLIAGYFQTGLSVFPMVPGHEWCGTIFETSDEVCLFGCQTIEEDANASYTCWCLAVSFGSFDPFDQAMFFAFMT